MRQDAGFMHFKGPGNLAFVPSLETFTRDIVSLGRPRRVRLDPVQGNGMVIGETVMRCGSITIWGVGKPASLKAFKTFTTSN
jgi:hypothetical protein